MTKLLPDASDVAMDIPTFRQSLVIWGKSHFRAFPWREANDPYRLLVAEIMLHRTQARQVVPIYRQFIERYPDLTSLAGVSFDDLNQILYPLGLRWRTELIAQMVMTLNTKFAGQVPRQREVLMSLPGVSDYIASAVRCFAWNIADPLIDTNTVRVVGRLYGLVIKDSSRRNTLFRQRISALVDPVEPRMYTYSLLDLADDVCTAKRVPACRDCPVKGWCSSANKFGAGDIAAKKESCS